MAPPTDHRQRASRRNFLRKAGWTAGGIVLAGGVYALTGAPFVKHSGTRSLRVSTFGGLFERSFAQYIYPEFTKASGIAVQSQEQPEGAHFLFQLAEANKAGNPPMDVCCASSVDVLRGRAQGLWRVQDTQRLSNVRALKPRFSADFGQHPDHVAAMSWYMTLVVNPKEMKPAPDSWSVLWQPRKAAFGVMSGSTSLILEIATKLHFGGNEILETKEGIDKVIAKIGEMKSNVKLWWQDEGTMQTALINDEVLGGTYMHDTAMVMRRNGSDVVSIFPKEGAVEATNAWCQPSASRKTDEATEFLNFMCTPRAQELIARHVGSAPVMERGKLSLSDTEFAAVSSQIPSIPTATEARFKFTSYIEQRFTNMITG
ncbi:putative spermidine/putrescine transport system substrate-binding protein [Rhizomicrobium palustre]|uniref:Putative spermidine/putrescine transport system substrate-binding protein n=1 Tax=Rhizomicrobium palustre TaxID=189966 RepID=A0A846N0N5_9PROT|nr:extracellular solute-binding protein [Rhizomicrobium palustre]NIK89514.1 putative spermidine/putrescine transport system substrate-binding protein [Rhizomicrobium palustre]